MGCRGSKLVVPPSSSVLPAGPDPTSMVPLQTLPPPPQQPAHWHSSTQSTTAPVTPSPSPGHNNGEPAHETARHSGHVSTQSGPAAPASVLSPHHGGVPPSPQSNNARTLCPSPYVGDIPMVLAAVPQLSQLPQRMHSYEYERGGRSSSRFHVPGSMSVDMQPQHGPPARGQMARAASVSVVERGHGQAPRTELVSTRSNQGRRFFTSIVKSTLPDDFRFRVLVVGKRNSGKSSLISAIFKVDMSVAPANLPGGTAFNSGFRPRDNRHVIIHEYSGLEREDLQTIRHFIAARSDVRSASERLHAIWICVTMSDAIDGRLDEGVRVILGMGVPVVLVFTKFDKIVSKVLSDIRGGDSRNPYESARSTAHTMFEGSCRSFFPRNPVPVEVVSTGPGFIDLIDKLVARTDVVINAHPHNALSEAQPRMSPVSLAWSVSQRASCDVTIWAAIEVGRYRYWRSLRSSRDFTGHSMENCLDVIHDDIIYVWNLLDKEKYLSSKGFKAEISYLVQDLSESPVTAPSLFSNSSGSNNTPAEGNAIVAAAWLNDPYQNTEENVGCVMGYIVDLTFILSSIFRSDGDVSPRGVRSATRNLDSGRKTSIHAEIRSFVRAAPMPTHLDSDPFIKKVTELIMRFCVPRSGSGYI
ncbi:hypothetical protein BJV74DRAFT_153229 [Russula compacta]|nr:hypothetical protein BJV74DRAFT_153229 [Russula compacta]